MVEEAFAAVYGKQQPERRAAGELEVLAYRGEAGWHLVTVGLAAVFAAGDDAGHERETGPGHPRAGPERGGAGAELTLLTPPAPEPPAWAFALLVGAARTALGAGRPLHAGARLAPGAPLDGARSGLVAVGVGGETLVTGVPLLRLVGVTAGEHALMGRVGTALVLAKLAERDPRGAHGSRAGVGSAP